MISVKIILTRKPVILSPNSQKTNKGQTAVGFVKFCLRIKIFVLILEKEVLFAKFRTMTLNIAKLHTSLMKKLTLGVLIFKIVLKA